MNIKELFTQIPALNSLVNNIFSTQNIILFVLSPIVFCASWFICDAETFFSLNFVYLSIVSIGISLMMLCFIFPFTFAFLYVVFKDFKTVGQMLTIACFIAFAVFNSICMSITYALKNIINFALCINIKGGGLLFTVTICLASTIVIFRGRFFQKLAEINKPINTSNN
jgi:hypothetical protein